MFSLAYYVHTIDPVCIRFPESFFLKGIYWYGVSYFIGFILAACLLRMFYIKKMSPLGPDLQSGLLMYIILGVLVGGRLGYMLFYRFDVFLAEPWILFKVWQSGMASHGGFLGVIVGIVCFAWVYRQKILEIADIVVCLAPPGIFLGRLANFINAELVGRVTDVPWAVIFPPCDAGYPLEWVLPRHPSQLYEAALEGLLLFGYTQFRMRSKNIKKIRHGQIAGEFLVGYGLVRIVCECFRQPDAPLIMGLTRGQFYSLFLIGMGILLVGYVRLVKTKLRVGE